ncbi:hypothetical protein AB4Z51_45070, partial [Bradyrhizobium sp. 2TAF36]|uniref:hypothetical protein n=1 Tax=Bradyrhizobium sp. 2TAF36 TaxID=3233016 RepID=UPI003F8DCF3B
GDVLVEPHFAGETLQLPNWVAVSLLAENMISTTMRGQMSSVLQSILARNLQLTSQGFIRVSPHRVLSGFHPPN